MTQDIEIGKPLTEDFADLRQFEPKPMGTKVIHDIRQIREELRKTGSSSKLVTFADGSQGVVTRSGCMIRAQGKNRRESGKALRKARIRRHHQFIAERQTKIA